MAAIQVTAASSFIGLSTDTKPASPSAGSTFVEADTRLTYVFDGTAWSVTG